MGKETINFVDIEVEKHTFYGCIGYLYDDYKFKPLHIILLKMSTYVISYDGRTKWMYFLIEDDDI